MTTKYPSWAAPRLSDTGIPFETARGRLGAATINNRLTPEERTQRARKRHQAWMAKTTPQQRTEWATAAGSVAATNRAKTMTPEDRRKMGAAGGRASAQTRMQLTTPEQRTEWARKAGIASAKARALKRGA